MSRPTLKARPTRSRADRALDALRDPLYRTGYALVANTAGTTAIGVVYWAVAAHLYDRQALGRCSALVSALILVSSLAQLNLANTLPRFLPRAGRSAGRLITYSYGASSIAALAAGLAFVTVMPRVSPQWQFLGASAPLAVMFVVAAVIWGVFALEDAALAGLHRAVVVPAENIVYGVCKLLLLVAVASVLSSTGIFASWVIPLVVIVPAINWLIFRHYLRDRESAAAPPELRARKILRFASGNYLGSLFAQAYGTLPPLLVLSALGAAANSSFYIAWMIASGLELVALNFATSLLVEASTAPHRLAELTRGVLVRCAMITVPGAAVLVLAARPILLIYGPAYASQASVLLAMLGVATIPASFVLVVLSLDRIARRVGRAAVTQLALAVLVLGGSWLLLGKLGINGVGLAWTGANVLVALARCPTVIGAARGRTAPAPAPTPAGGRLRSPDLTFERAHTARACPTGPTTARSTRICSTGCANRWCRKGCRGPSAG